MRPTTVVVAVVMMITVSAVARSGSAAGPASEDGSLLELADLAAARVQLADAVAAAKWGTNAPVDDPVREKIVLDRAATKSTELGIDPAVSVVVFTDQIEANKAVQHALFARWSADPGQAPTTRPDLGQIRPVLDRIADGLLTQLKATQTMRSHRSCAARLATAGHRAGRVRGLDRIHQDALSRALVSVCGQTGHR